MIKENIYKIKKTDKIMNKRGISFWDAIIWIGIGILLGWALLKSLGIIHSPIWVETLPYFGIGISAIGGAYKLGKIKQGIENTEQKIDKIVNIEERFKKLENEHNLCMDGKLNIHNNKTNQGNLNNRPWRR